MWFCNIVLQLLLNWVSKIFTNKGQYTVYHKCIILFLYFQLETYSTKLIASDSWVYEYPQWTESPDYEVITQRWSP